MPLKLIPAILLLLVSAVVDAWSVFHPVKMMTAEGMSLLFCVAAAAVMIGLIARQEWARMFTTVLGACYLLAALMWASLLVKMRVPIGSLEAEQKITMIALDGLIALYLPWCGWQEDVKRWFQAARR